jgi:hypothetical protein
LSGNFGGRHEPLEVDSTKYSLFKFKVDNENGGYYDIYAELYKKFGEKFDLKIGADYGQIDPKKYHIIYRTLAGKTNIGPFSKKHTFGLQGELQVNSVRHYAETDYAQVKEVVINNAPHDQINWNDTNSTDLTVWTKYYKNEGLIPNEVKTEQSDIGLNWLGEISYSFASLIKFGFLLELETVIGKSVFNSDVVVIDDIYKKSRLFPSCQIAFTPVPNHSFFLEGGSFSSKKICNMGVCTIIPAFKGIKFTIKSTL